MSVKSSSVLLEPRNVNEKTLELSITNELLNLFSGFHWRSSPEMLKKLFRPMTFPSRLPWIHGAFAMGLAAREEGTKGGWDVKITVPNGILGGSRALFIQFKKGVHQDANGDPCSVFERKQHVQFKLDNKKKNQHKALQELAEYLELNDFPKDSVVYAFPRITSKDQFEKLRGRLLFYTSFLSIPEIDNDAKQNGVSLVDGKDHFFKSCYKDRNLREVCSNPFKPQDDRQSTGFLIEVFRYKLSKIWNAIMEARTDYRTDFLRFNLSFLLSSYLGIEEFYPPSFARPFAEEEFARNFLRQNSIYWNNIDRTVFGEDWNLQDSLENRLSIYDRVMAIFETNKQFIDAEDIGRQYSIPFVNSIDIRIQSENIGTDSFFDYQIL